LAGMFPSCCLDIAFCFQVVRTEELVTAKIAKKIR